jgi:predicted RNA-binding protein YlqC (UPF0109 family)
MDDEGMLRDLVAFIARSVVDDPDAVDVQVREQDGAFIVELRVAPADMGKVIGRGGRIARAMRAVVRAAALKSGSRVMLEILQ